MDRDRLIDQLQTDIAHITNANEELALIVVDLVAVIDPARHPDLLGRAWELVGEPDAIRR